VSPTTPATAQPRPRAGMRVMGLSSYSDGVIDCDVHQSLKFIYRQALASNAPYNEAARRVASWNKRPGQAIGELDHAKAQSPWSQVQEIQHTRVTTRGRTNAGVLDGVSTKVKRLEPSSAGVLGSSAGVLGNKSFLDAWNTMRPWFARQIRRHRVGAARKEKVE
jgi:hypothetical protein